MRIDFSPTRPNPEDLRLEFLSGALLIPSLSSDPSQEKATLETAIGAVDLKALDAADQDKFDASLRTAQSDLEPLKPTFKQATLHLTGNSHIDAAWLWPWTETVDAVRRTFWNRAAVDGRISRSTPTPNRPPSTTYGWRRNIRR